MEGLRPLRSPASKAGSTPLRGKGPRAGLKTAHGEVLRYDQNDSPARGWPGHGGGCPRVRIMLSRAKAWHPAHGEILRYDQNDSPARWLPGHAPAYMATPLRGKGPRAGLKTAHGGARRNHSDALGLTGDGRGAIWSPLRIMLSRAKAWHPARWLPGHAPAYMAGSRPLRGKGPRAGLKTAHDEIPRYDQNDSLARGWPGHGGGCPRVRIMLSRAKAWHPAHGEIPRYDQNDSLAR